jgi:hypothetical protein
VSGLTDVITGRTYNTRWGRIIQYQASLYPCNVQCREPASNQDPCSPWLTSFSHLSLQSPSPAHLHLVDPSSHGASRRLARTQGGAHGRCCAQWRVKIPWICAACLHRHQQGTNADQNCDGDGSHNIGCSSSSDGGQRVQIYANVFGDYQLCLYSLLQCLRSSLLK